MNSAVLSASREQGWVLSHFTVRTDTSDHVVKGGDMLRLRHADSEGFINACRDDAKLRATESPLRKILESTRGSRIFVQSESSSARTCRSIIEIELPAHQKGDPIRENQWCRLKSAMDGKYVLVVGKQLCLARKPDAGEDPGGNWERGTRFALINAKRVSDTITVAYGGWVYLKHGKSFVRVKVSRADADAESGTRATRSEASGASGGGDGGDELELELCSSEELSDRDAFRVSSAPAEEVHSQFSALKMQHELVMLYVRMRQLGQPAFEPHAMMRDWGLSDVAPPPPSSSALSESDCLGATVAVRRLIRFVLDVPAETKLTSMEVLELAQMPSPARQKVVRDCYIIEWLLGVIDLGWNEPALFDQNPELVQEVETAQKLSEDEEDAAVSDRARGLIPLFAVQQLAHRLLKWLLTNNHRNAVVVNQMVRVAGVGPTPDQLISGGQPWLAGLATFHTPRSRRGRDTPGAQPS